ncbi:protein CHLORORESPIRATORY REDUCTION 42, chloroplastic [Vicia villosa]|uniref:protein CHLORORESPIRATORY REDUCTION 42, chloroplastic n=1 Tax=Vicia villosa TaxID=3911 RepID=UPI00273C919B|nr:protein CHLORORESPIRATORY REDUCTION 42, chloroplastic [Vicia villosa]
MSLSLSCATTKPSLKFHSCLKPQHQRPNNSVTFVRCESKDSSDENEFLQKRSKLDKGSPVIIIEAPRMIKTAASVPCLRVNSGLVKPGDVGRIVSRKPKDVWAVRLSIGTYLIDGKYFKPLDLAEYS